MSQSDSTFVESKFTKEDFSFETPLRPQSFADFSGQEEVKKKLDVFTGAALKREDVLGHCLISGPPGLGKTTLANIIAKTMGSSIVVTSGPVVEKPGDLAGILTNLQRGDVLFIDEIHRLHRTVEEYLYPAMEDFVLDLVIDSGPSARTVQVKLNRFTLIGATTRQGLLSSPMRSRFPLSVRLDYYSVPTLQKILKRTGALLDLELTNDALAEVAKRSRGTPRVANHLLRWVRDVAQVKAHKVVDKEMAIHALQMLHIDEKGLEEIDKKILQVIIDHHNGGPVGLNTLAVAVGEEPHTLEEVHEPFLILQGFLNRTPRGRVATDLAYKHLKKVSNKQKQPYPKNLFQ